MSIRWSSHDEWDRAVGRIRNGPGPAGQPAPPSHAEPRNRDDLGPRSRPLSGPDRLRETIARDRGHRAPAAPVLLCGDPAHLWENAVRADKPAGQSRLTRSERWEVRLGNLLLCPDCLGFRFGPVHLGLKIFGVHGR